MLDADGVEIKVGDTVYTSKGEERIVKEIDFDDDEECPEHTVWCGEYKFGYKFVYIADGLTHTRPDSWELLEEDAAKGVCEYAGATPCGGIDAHECSSCRFDGAERCEAAVARDLIRRAKALAGVDRC